MRKFIPLLTALLLLACAVPVLPLPAASNPEPAPGSIETIVVATAGAAQTMTALVVPSPTFTPTATLPPTLTHTVTPTETATVIFIIPTSTSIPTATQPFVTQSVGSNCQVIAQSPVNQTVFTSGDKFTTEWTLRNTGSDTWLSNNFDFFYSGGTDMHKRDILDLPNNVGTNGEVTFAVDMVAPNKSGTYTSTWNLGKKNNPVCKVSVTIVVK